MALTHTARGEEVVYALRILGVRWIALPGRSQQVVFGDACQGVLLPEVGWPGGSDGADAGRDRHGDLRFLATTSGAFSRTATKAPGALSSRASIPSNMAHLSRTTLSI